MAEQSYNYYRPQTTQDASVRVPDRPNFADPCELLPLFETQEESNRSSNMRSNNNSNANNNTIPIPRQRPADELVGTLLPAANNGTAVTRSSNVSTFAAIPIAVAVPVYTGTASLPPPAGGWQQQHQQHHQVPSAPPLPATVYASNSKTGSKFDEVAVHAIPSEALLPDKTFHADVVARPAAENEEEAILNANAIAQLRSEEDSRLIRKGEMRFQTRAAVGENIVYTANEVAFIRDAEGLEVDTFTHDYAMAANMSRRDAARRREDSSKVSTKGDENEEFYKDSRDGNGGYKMGDYEVSDYEGYQYKSDYEYKSVYE